MRQAEKQHRRNASARSSLRTLVKKAEKAIASGDRDAANSACRTAMSMLDKTANKDLIHKNKAARKKSRLNAQLRAL